MKLSQRFFAMFTLAALLPVMMAGAAALVLLQRNTAERAVSLLDAMAAIQESRVENVLAENEERLSSFATRADMRRLLESWSSADASTEEREGLRFSLNEIVSDVLHANDSYREVTISDAAGVVVASTTAERVGVNVSDQMYYRAGRLNSSVSEVYLDGSGLERFRLVGPVFSAGRRVGTAMIETDAQRFFAIASDYRALGRTGETIIARSTVGGEAEVLTPLRYDPQSALLLRIAREPNHPPILDALARREEVFQNVTDFRGAKVFAATRYVDSAGFGIVVKMETSEVFESLQPLRRLLWAAIMASIAAAAVVAAYAGRKMAAPIVRLTTTARTIAEGGEGTRMEVHGSDETADLARSFNIMVDKLLAERLRLEASVKSLPVGILVVDESDKIILRNDHIAHILGLPARLQYELADVISATPFTMQLQEKIKECLKRGRVVEINDEFVSDRAVRMLLSPIKTGVSGAHGFVLLVEDVSGARKLERAKADFVSVASHQLRTPLTAIKGIVSMLLDRDLGPLSGRQESFIAEMQHSTDRMINLVNALLNTSRIDLGIFSVEPEPVDLAQLGESVIEEMALPLQRKKIVLDMNIDTDIGPVMVDPKLMRMIFQNLLSNAMKYTGTGGKVTCEVKRKGTNIVMTVTDTGYGIPEKQQDKIFTKMFRADNAQQLDPDGTGLGLYIVKAIVEATGGEIGFTSIENRGTTFTITLPRDGMRRKHGTKDLEVTPG